MKTMPYYGWLVLAAAAVCELLVQGATSYSAGLFVLPLQAEFHISRAQASLAGSILFLGSAIAAPLVGQVLDRFPIRWVMCSGAVLFSGALLLIASTASLRIMMLALLFPAALGFMALGPLTTAALASRWFFRRRGLALGLAAMATSGGGLVTWLMATAIGRYGWRPALMLEAVIIALIVIVLALFVLRDSPLTSGLGDHPENRGRDDARNDAPALRWRTIMGHRAFWIPTLVLATIVGTSQAVLTAMVPYGVQLGFAVRDIAGLIFLFSVAAALTKILAGLLADHLNQKALLLAAPVFMMLSLGLLYVATSFGALAGCACLAAIALGCALPTTTALIAKAFGAASFGAVMGWTYVAIGFCTIAGVPFAGWIFDRTGSYRPAFLAFGVIAALVLAATLFLAPRQQEKIGA